MCGEDKELHVGTGVGTGNSDGSITCAGTYDGSSRGTSV